MEMLAVAWMDIRGGNGAVFDPRIEQQGQSAHPGGRPAGHAALGVPGHRQGPAVCLRLLRLDMQAQALSLRSLGYLDSQIEMLHHASRADGGVVVLAGVVGSGKSTTIATLIRTLPDSRKVITLEDPVEYVIDNALQNSVSRNLDDSSATVFDAKLRTVKRSAMNDLLIGEIPRRGDRPCFHGPRGVGREPLYNHPRRLGADDSRTPVLGLHRRVARLPGHPRRAQIAGVPGAAAPALSALRLAAGQRCMTARTARRGGTGRAA